MTEEAPDQPQDTESTSDDLFDVTAEVRVTCTGVPGPDPQATVRQMVAGAFGTNPSISFEIVDVGEPDPRQDS